MTLLRRSIKRIVGCIPNRVFMAFQAELDRKRSNCIADLLRSKGDNLSIASSVFISVPYNVTVGSNCHINEFAHILGGGGVSIGDGVYIANHVSIVSIVHPTDLEYLGDVTEEEQKELLKPVTIEDNVWLGSHVVVLPGVRLGRSCIVGAGSVVTRDIPPYAIAVGSPAKVIRFKELRSPAQSEQSA